jgi:hypothetical protein
MQLLGLPRWTWTGASRRSDDGDAPGYLTLVVRHEALRRQVTVLFTPWGGPEPEEQVEALLERALCP